MPYGQPQGSLQLILSQALQNCRVSPPASTLAPLPVSTVGVKVFNPANKKVFKMYTLRNLQTRELKDPESGNYLRN